MSVRYGDKKLRIGVFGAGWWSHFQIPAWLEIGNIEIVALYNRTVSKAEAVKEKFSLSCNVYSDPEALFNHEDIDFADIITETPFHKALVLMSAKRGIPVVCQKPVAFSYEDCLEMWDACKKADIPFIINENYRWQSPIRQIRKLIDSGVIGNPFRAQIQLTTGGPYQLQNQPFLKSLRHYVLFDLGVHAFDVARFLFGEPDRIYCQSLRTVDFIRGDDMALCMLTYKDLLCNIQITDMFSTKIQAEGLGGLIELDSDYQIRITSKEAGTKSYDCTDWKRYPYISPEDEINFGTEIMDSIIQAQRNILDELRYGAKAETSISEYIKTMEITFAAIRSALTHESVPYYRY